MRTAQYAAARAVVQKVQSHFSHHAGEARDGLAAPADADAIETIIDAAFWASLRREEGYPPTISLAFVSPEQARRPLVFERPFALTPEALTRLAPAVERPGIHLGVWRVDGGLAVWGMTRGLPPFCFVVEVAAPGLLVVKHRRREESGKFVNVAVLEGDQIKLIDERAARVPDCPALVTSLLGFDSTAPADSVNVLAALAVSMRQHGRGGSLLLVPGGTETWRESILRPIAYSVVPFSELAGLMAVPAERRKDQQWNDAFRRSVDAIAGLTAVDGATLMTDRYELLAFGAKIGRREGAPRIEQVVVTEPVEGFEASATHPAQLGGTRHQSAAQFVHDQHDALAMVASQDGRFTIFAWSPCDERVYAHRAEALLL